MTSLRHIALGCCVLSALAGILRLFWPENGFKSVINAVLVLYILTDVYKRQPRSNYKITGGNSYD